MSSSSKRRDTDMMKLMMAGFNVEPINESVHEFHVYFNGPADSPYSGGVWKVLVKLPNDYPNRSPSVRFVNQIYHPNIHIPNGDTCVNVLDDEWSSAFDLVTVFGVILPQLLMEPNPSNPLNKDAANLLKSDKLAYENKVKEYRDRCAKPGEVMRREYPVLRL